MMKKTSTPRMTRVSSTVPKPKHGYPLRNERGAVHAYPHTEMRDENSARSAQERLDLEKVLAAASAAAGSAPSAASATRGGQPLGSPPGPVKSPRGKRVSGSSPGRGGGGIRNATAVSSPHEAAQGSAALHHPDEDDCDDDADSVAVSSPSNQSSSLSPSPVKGTTSILRKAQSAAVLPTPGVKVAASLSFETNKKPPTSSSSARKVEVHEQDEFTRNPSLNQFETVKSIVTGRRPSPTTSRETTEGSPYTILAEDGVTESQYDALVDHGHCSSALPPRKNTTAATRRRKSGGGGSVEDGEEGEGGGNGEDRDFGNGGVSTGALPSLRPATTSTSQSVATETTSVGAAEQEEASLRTVALVSSSIQTDDNAVGAGPQQVVEVHPSLAANAASPTAASPPPARSGAERLLMHSASPLRHHSQRGLSSLSKASASVSLVPVNTSGEVDEVQQESSEMQLLEARLRFLGQKKAQREALQRQIERERREEDEFHKHSLDTMLCDGDNGNHRPEQQTAEPPQPLYIAQRKIRAGYAHHRGPSVRLESFSLHARNHPYAATSAADRDALVLAEKERERLLRERLEKEKQLEEAERTRKQLEAAEQARLRLAAEERDRQQKEAEAAEEARRLREEQAEVARLLAIQEKVFANQRIDVSHTESQQRSDIHDIEGSEWKLLVKELEEMFEEAMRAPTPDYSLYALKSMRQLNHEDLAPESSFHAFEHHKEVEERKEREKLLQEQLDEEQRKKAAAAAAKVETGSHQKSGGAEANSQVLDEDDDEVFIDATAVLRHETPKKSSETQSIPPETNESVDWTGVPNQQELRQATSGEHEPRKYPGDEEDDDSEFESAASSTVVDETELVDDEEEEEDDAQEKEEQQLPPTKESPTVDSSKESTSPRRPLTMMGSVYFAPGTKDEEEEAPDNGLLKSNPGSPQQQTPQKEEIEKEGETAETEEEHKDGSPATSSGSADSFVDAGGDDDDDDAWAERFIVNVPQPAAQHTPGGSRRPTAVPFATSAVSGTGAMAGTYDTSDIEADEEGAFGPTTALEKLQRMPTAQIKRGSKQLDEDGEESSAEDLSPMEKLLRQNTQDINTARGGGGAAARRQQQRGSTAAAETPFLNVPIEDVESLSGSMSYGGAAEGRVHSPSFGAVHKSFRTVTPEKERSGGGGSRTPRGSPAEGHGHKEGGREREKPVRPLNNHYLTEEYRQMMQHMRNTAHSSSGHAGGGGGGSSSEFLEPDASFRNAASTRRSMYFSPHTKLDAEDEEDSDEMLQLGEVVIPPELESYYESLETPRERKDFKRTLSRMQSMRKVQSQAIMGGGEGAAASPPSPVRNKTAPTSTTVAADDKQRKNRFSSPPPLSAVGAAVPVANDSLRSPNVLDATIDPSKLQQPPTPLQQKRE